jgi:hypothetical protein
VAVVAVACPGCCVVNPGVVKSGALTGKVVLVKGRTDVSAGRETTAVESLLGTYIVSPVELLPQPEKKVIAEIPVSSVKYFILAFLMKLKLQFNQVLLEKLALFL